MKTTSTKQQTTYILRETAGKPGVTHDHVRDGPLLPSVALGLLHLATEVHDVTHDGLASGQARRHKGSELNDIAGGELEGVEGGAKDLCWGRRGGLFCWL